MTWFKQLGNWVDHSPASEKVPAEASTQHLLASLLTMAWFVEARDPYTGGHLWRVSRYAWLLAEQAQFSEAEAARIGLGRDKALAILGAERGTQFDARFADLFIALGEAGRLDHVMGHSDEGIPLQACPVCGPTLVLRKAQQAGEKIYCRNCAGEFELKKAEQGLVATPTGGLGRAEDLEPEADTELIQQTVRSAVNAMPEGALLASAPC